eukprot:COSAG05_NODE_572_length_8615_cov_58.796031_2_plen_89_part_00
MKSKIVGEAEEKLTAVCHSCSSDTNQKLTIRKRKLVHENGRSLPAANTGTEALGTVGGGNLGRVGARAHLADEGAILSCPCTELLKST